MQVTQQPITQDGMKAPLKEVCKSVGYAVLMSPNKAETAVHDTICWHN